MNIGFNLSEAQEMLGLAYAADLMGPAGFKKEEVINWSKNYSLDIDNPLFKDDGTFYPYPDKQVWPKGWTPGINAKKKAKSPWDDSVIVPMPFRGGLEGILKTVFQGKAKEGSVRSFLSDQLAATLAKQFEFMWLGANNVVITYNEKRNAYAIGFAGTQNQLGQYQELVFTPVSASDLELGVFKSNTGYIYNPEAIDFKNPDFHIGCSVHLGFRLALEQFTVNAASGDSLKDVLIELNRHKRGKDKNGRLNLYVTGHSLGAALGTLFTAWLQANEAKFVKEDKRFPSLNLKMYVFATPKTGNDGFCKSFDMGLTNRGMAFHIDNYLDAVPEIPFSFQTPYSLGNLDMVSKMFDPVEDAFIQDEEQSEAEAIEQIAQLEKKSDEKSRSKIMEIIGKQLIRSAGKVVKVTDWASRGPIKDNNYRHPGHQIILRGDFPKTRKSNMVEAAFYPGDNIAKPTDMAAPNIVASWWHHWPWVYRKALDEMFD